MKLGRQMHLSAFGGKHVICGKKHTHNFHHHNNRKIYTLVDFSLPFRLNYYFCKIFLMLSKGCELPNFLCVRYCCDNGDKDLMEEKMCN